MPFSGGHCFIQYISSWKMTAQFSTYRFAGLVDAFRWCCSGKCWAREPRRSVTAAECLLEPPSLPGGGPASPLGPQPDFQSPTCHIASPQEWVGHFRFCDCDRCHFYSHQCDHTDPRSKTETSFKCSLWFNISAVLRTILCKDER